MQKLHGGQHQTSNLFIYFFYFFYLFQINKFLIYIFEKEKFFKK
jgi:hypothetical protein